MIPSNQYYDHIAKDYNTHMTESDNQVRNIVMNAFVKLVKAGNVVDFGGGTGLDLPRLLNNQYEVKFLEPSAAMREIAKSSLNSGQARPFFVEENTDFHDWSDTSLPFKEKVDGILANFAVLNCIEDIEFLFEKLSLICTPGCKIMASVIDTFPIKMIGSYSTAVAIKSLLNIPLTTQNNYKGVTQKTFLHTKSHYKTSSFKYFDFVSYSSIKSSHFAMLILSKK
ncbi:MAG: methyltransferase domain-containing protein [Chitinophagales bacterium]